MKKKFKLPLNWLLFTLLLGGWANASTVHAQWLSNAQYLKAFTAKKKFLAISEEKGIALLDDQGKVLSDIPTRSEQMDFRWLPNSTEQGVLTTLDVNTGNIQLIKVDLSLNTIELIKAYVPKNTAIDVLCLGVSSSNIELFTVNVAGEVTQMILNTSAQEDWQLIELNRFPAGLNMKSCAVNDISNSLYITEENIGVWRYSTNPEHEIIRTLLQLPEGLEVEAVNTTAQGDVAVVSPDINSLWLLDHGSNAFKPLPLPEGVSPKTVQLKRTGESLMAYIYNDKSGRTIKVELGQHRSLAQETVHNNQIASLPAYAQTDPVVSYDDAADDPAIWVNSKNPSQSLVYGTDKKHGLHVYNLKGKLIKSLPVGRVNNVDIRYNINFDGKLFDIAAASNRTNKSISLFTIDKHSGLPTLIADIKTDLADPYGLCMGDYGDDLAVWINDTDGRFQRYDIEFDGQLATAKKTLEWTVPSQPEGCISDDTNKRLFYGEESTGVWLKMIDSKTPDKLITSLNADVEADIEGVSLYTLDGLNYLVVSSQGNNKYAVYAVDDNNKYLGVFEIAANWSKMIDGTSETDGLAVTSQSLGAELPNGLMVIQDGHNVLPKANQNFKLVKGSLLKDWLLARVIQ
jgi:3-phytase